MKSHLRERALILFEQVDVALTNWMSRYSLVFLRYSLAVIFIWFGLLKFIPGMSPTVDVIENVTNKIFFGIVPAWTAVYGLAAVECLIGFGLLLNIFMRLTLLGLFIQMIATSTPVFILPDIVFSKIPFGLTIDGHHIIKNLILIGAGLTLGATVRGQRNSLSPVGIKINEPGAGPY
jgi:uncharacterized membrane protein YkgB